MSELTMRIIVSCGGGAMDIVAVQGFQSSLEVSEVMAKREVKILRTSQTLNAI